jgi:hypothetical protein
MTTEILIALAVILIITARGVYRRLPAMRAQRLLGRWARTSGGDVAANDNTRPKGKRKDGRLP